MKSKWRALAPDQRKSAVAKLAATALIVVFGFGSGWIAGKALSGVLSHPSPTDTNSRPGQSQLETSQPLFESEHPQRDPRRDDDDKAILAIRSDSHSAKLFGHRVLEHLLKAFKHHKHHGKHKD